MNNILVLGANGMLGRYVYTYLKRNPVKDYRILHFTRNNLSLNGESITCLNRHLVLSKNDIVINCIGIVPQRKDSNPLDSILINSVLPHELQYLCSALGAKLIHITTDCVFSGRTGGYDEKDEHDETSVYGKSKSLGEPDKACVIRTSIIGEELRHKKSLLEWVKASKGQTINGYDNHLWNGVTCLELSKFIHHIIENNMIWEGVRHIHSPDVCSKFDLITKINELYGLTVDIIPSFAPKSIYRTLDSIYDTTKLVTKSIKEQIREQKEYSLL